MENRKHKESSSIDLRNIQLTLKIFLLVSCIKVLLIPTYHSTDFEVHRNWLAITHSLPLNQWYTNAKSQWTLDYPPFFAWFEYFLSKFAAFFDSEMLKVDNLNYASNSTVLFQRGSVIFADILFAYGVKELGSRFCSSYDSFLIYSLLCLCNIGLLMVDHIHFQYNGFLLGFLLLSAAKVSQIKDTASILKGALYFAILLNFKHIYLYVAPAFIVWLLRSYCLDGNQFFQRISLLGGIVISVLCLSFGPFLTQIPQVVSRLFPFKRGLVHAYWAPNAWSLYIACDKVVSLIYKRLGWLISSKSAVMTGGLVQEQSFTVLPTPTPFVTFLLTFLSMTPALWKLFTKKDTATNPDQFIRSIILCGLSSFMFGWHVHEKAILTAIIPLCVLSVKTKEDAKVFLILSSAGHTALLPLLYPTNLTPLKFLLLLVYTLVSILLLSRFFKQHLLRFYEYFYIFLLPLLTVYETVGHRILFGDALAFLPLALTSIYCALGVSYSWILYYKVFFYSFHQNDAAECKKCK